MFICLLQQRCCLSTSSVLVKWLLLRMALAASVASNINFLMNHRLFTVCAWCLCSAVQNFRKILLNLIYLLLFVFQRLMMSRPLLDARRMTSANMGGYIGGNETRYPNYYQISEASRKFSFDVCHLKTVIFTCNCSCSGCDSVS